MSGWESCEQQESKYSKRTLESWEFDELQESSADCSSDSSSDSQLSNQESTYSKMIAETIHVLAQRSETKILECLQEDASRFYEIATYYDLKKLPKQYLLDLVLRTSLESSTYKPASITKKYVESRVFFKCFGGKAMEVCGSIRGYGWQWANWEELELKFTLPDGKVLELEGPLEIETLSPVTELLQESACQSMQEAEHMPEIDNFYTAVYFLHALEFADASDIAFNRFDSLYPLYRYPESGEEPDDWYDDNENESSNYRHSQNESWDYRHEDGQIVFFKRGEGY